MVAALLKKHLLIVFFLPLAYIIGLDSNDITICIPVTIHVLTHTLLFLHHHYLLLSWRHFLLHLLNFPSSFISQEMDFEK